MVKIGLSHELFQESHEVKVMRLYLRPSARLLHFVPPTLLDHFTFLISSLTIFV